MKNRVDPLNQRIFYGWYVVASTFTALFIGLSSGFYTVSVFLEPLQDAFGWTRTQVSSGFMVASFLSGLQSMTTGFALSRWGVKKVQLTGALIIVLALTALSLMNHLVQYFCFMVLLFTGTSFVGTISCQTIISQWFDRKRGVAMGLIMAGNGTGGMAMIFIAQTALSAWGWRWAYRTLAVLVLLVVFPVVLLVTRNRPEDMGLQKDGLVLGVDPVLLNAGRSMGHTYGQALKTGSFRVLCGLMLLYGMVIGSMTQHAIAMLRTLGSTNPSFYWSLALGISVGGRLVLGNMADRISKKILLAVCWLFAGLGFASVLLTGRHPVFALVFSICYGLSMGSFVTLVPLYLGELYGIGHFSKIMGTAHFFLVSGISIGTIVLGRIFDLTGSYVNGIFFLLAITGVGFILNVTVGSPESGNSR